MQSITEIVLDDLGAALQFARGALATSGRIVSKSSHSFLGLPAQVFFVSPMCQVSVCGVIQTGGCPNRIVSQRLSDSSWSCGGASVRGFVNVLSTVSSCCVGHGIAS